MTYLRMTNGSTTMLVDIYNETRQAELIEDGFFIDTDKDNVPKVVDSKDLLKTRNPSHAEMIRSIQEKLGHKSEANKNKR